MTRRSSLFYVLSSHPATGPVPHSARTLLRIHHRTTRLVVADEATSALDPVAERNLLGALLDARAGKTVVLITHRFHPLVHDADRILCVPGIPLLVSFLPLTVHVM